MRERKEKKILKKSILKNKIEIFTTYYKKKKKKFFVFVLVLHHKHCASFAPKIYNCVIKKKKKRIHKRGEKTEPIINQSFIEKKNK